MDPRVRLADFILANLEPILAEWESFARSIWPEGGVVADPAELRDHAEQILRAAAADMRTDQSPDQRSAKSMGRGHDTAAGRRLDNASDQHGAGRVGSGFKLPEVIAEYRAMRAAVLRLWRESLPDAHLDDLDDVTRFNEAIDQSLTYAVESFTQHIDRARQMFLAILGHDLRTPLAAIRLTAEASARRAGDDDAARQRALSIASSAKTMHTMIGDLLDFTASGLGGGMPLSPVATDLDSLCRSVVAETAAAHPGCPVAYERQGDTAGVWDAARLRQVVSNLLANAMQHGHRSHAPPQAARPSDAAPCVRVALRGEPAAVTLTVHNRGPAIPPDLLPVIFDPLRRGDRTGEHTATPGAGHLGLGLYIAHQVVVAHRGTIAADSSPEEGTTLTVRLPRESAVP